MVFCTNCGTDWPEKVHFCGKCGTSLVSKPDVEQEKRPSRSSQEHPPESTETNTNISNSESTAWDEVISPMKMLALYSGKMVGLVLLGFIGLIALLLWGIDENGKLDYIGIIKLIITGAALVSIYKIFKMPETSEGINRSRKVTSMVVILIAVYIAFNYLGDGDDRGGHYLENFAHDVRNADYSSACSIMMENDGQFLSGNRLQECIDDYNQDCGSSGCNVEVSVLDTTNTGKKTAHTGNILAYKVRITSEKENGASWCDLWYGAKNINSGKYGMAFDNILIADDGTNFENEEQVSCS